MLEYIARGLNLLPQVLLSAHLHRFPELIPLAVFIRQVLKCILYHLVGYLDLGRPGDRLVSQLLLNLLKVLDDTLLVLNFLLQLKVQSFVLLLRLLCLVFVLKNLLRMLLQVLFVGLELLVYFYIVFQFRGDFFILEDQKFVLLFMLKEFGL